MVHRTLLSLLSTQFMIIDHFALQSRISQTSNLSKSIQFQYDTIRHDTTRHDTTRHATPRHATPRHATPRHATPRHATPRHNATQRNATQRNATQYFNFKLSNQKVQLVPNEYSVNHNRMIYFIAWEGTLFL